MRNVIKSEEKTPERVTQHRTVAPLVDIFENRDEVLMLADIPGVKEDQVNIRFEKSHLTFEGMVQAEPGNEREQPFLYTRTFVLPGGINADAIAAELNNGVLKIHLPKHDSLKPRVISVRAG